MQAVQWVGEEDWVYRTTFESTGDEGCADMVFEGLDTFAVVFREFRLRWGRGWDGGLMQGWFYSQ